ncbi:MAG: hypothetical protein MUC99_09040 [Anaerolineae bacterium]|jgi:hypothetical protein|nr:hypothetical protein [Anaerolineae bacterium]
MLRFLVSLGLGALLGLGVGLYLGWVQFPLEYINSPISALDPKYRDEYTVMVAQGFQDDADSVAAIQRLRVLGIENVPEYVFGQAERYITNSRSPVEIQALIALSEGLGRTSPLFEPYRPPVGSTP